MINTIIVDDELAALDLLEAELSRHCPELQIMMRFDNPIKALEMIPELKPDMLFLDIEMPGMNGIQLVEKLHEKGLNCGIVFVTSYREHALSAFGINALEYILKPDLDPERLQNAVEKYQKADLGHQLSNIRDRLSPPNRLRISSTKGFDLIPLDQITHCEADGGVTKIFLYNKTKIVGGKPLGYYGKLLPHPQFIRIHHKYLINRDFIRTFDNKDQIVTLFNDTALPVANQRLHEFFKAIGNWAL